jgi:MFS family permease
MRAVYAGVALLAGASALLVLAFADEVHSSRGPARAFDLAKALRESFGDLRELRARGSLRSAVALMFWTQFGLGATNPTLDLFVRDLPSHVAWLAPTTGALFSAAAAASLLAMPLWGRYGDRRGAYPALLRCAVCSALALIFQGASPSYEVLLVARVAFGAAMAGSGPLAFGVAAAESSADQRGGAMGIVFAARALSIAIAASAGGALAAWLGFRTVFFLSGAVLLGCVGLARRVVNERRDRAVV